MVLKTTSELGYIVKSSPTREEVENEDDEDINKEIKIILISHLASEEIADELLDIIDVKDVNINDVEIDFF